MKKIPMRRCLGCNVSKPKKELLRVVRTPDGAAEFDPTGKANGRGAYICNDKACFIKAVKSRRLQKSLETDISAEVTEALERRLADG